MHTVYLLVVGPFVSIDCQHFLHMFHLLPHILRVRHDCFCSAQQGVAYRSLALHVLIGVPVQVLISVYVFTVDLVFNVQSSTPHYYHQGV